MALLDPVQDGQGVDDVVGQPGLLTGQIEAAPLDSQLTLDLADFFLADVSLLPVNMINRSAEVAPEVLRLLPELSSGALTLPYESYGMDALGEAVERLRTGKVVGKIVLDMGYAGT
ncbi:NADPH:quinone reductase-like Zn-dependent oxidoreductase [Streptomyces sp. SAI-135]|uniref:hypothetical protein n=1 Tax=unclassified Streptomyces TaxID=2593676 RepID=UPI0024772A5F|nr:MULTISPECIES: hypothetical protein [unclassified Streptomyces]MDH6514105.1 NADPH:quinone reductase-like Zn-dependent oxidoreductase [Streptomyces sp. SAI-090]MDH6565377.1 NADPH:quinone reductase-like Zn-dependent oxidoreductase [Streptomyces sp. SAI-117]MDH6621815.1 NADPH:quinone reductase-like Zn-dependent oxidoreductase [Streptomyces sp. SAI-135]